MLQCWRGDGEEKVAGGGEVMVVGGSYGGGEVGEGPHTPRG